MNNLHFSKLKEAIEKKDISIWNKFISELDIQIDLSDADLPDTDLKNANLKGADLRGTNTYGIAKSIFQGSKHFAVQIGEFISIGCYTLTISEWGKRANEIAKRENYTEVEKNEYLKYIKECKEKM